MKVQNYKRDGAISYALGVTVTIELLLRRPERVLSVLLHSALTDGDGYRRIQSLCAERGIPVEVNDKAFRILSQKENCYAIGVFEKYEDPPRPGRRQVLLVNPSNAGNLGTILRTAAGFGLRDLSVILPAVDPFDPKSVRASMGAFFSLHLGIYESFARWREDFPTLPCFPFMLTASRPLQRIIFPDPCALVFGNEASGLPEAFAHEGQPVIIPHGDVIDSLNLPTAVGIALYELTKADWSK